MKLAKVTVDEFFEIPVGARDEMVQELADGLGALIQDYTSFVSSCGMNITNHTLFITFTQIILLDLIEKLYG